MSLSRLKFSVAAGYVGFSEESNLKGEWIQHKKVKCTNSSQNHYPNALNIAGAHGQIFLEL